MLETHWLEIGEFIAAGKEGLDVTIKDARLGMLASTLLILKFGGLLAPL